MCPLPALARAPPAGRRGQPHVGCGPCLLASVRATWHRSASCRFLQRAWQQLGSPGALWDSQCAGMVPPRTHPWGSWGQAAAGPGVSGSGAVSISLPQVLPDVLHVCQLGVCGADAAEDTQLAAPVPVLPLVGLACRRILSRGPALPDGAAATLACASLGPGMGSAASCRGAGAVNSGCCSHWPTGQGGTGLALSEPQFPHVCADGGQEGQHYLRPVSPGPAPASPGPTLCPGSQAPRRSSIPSPRSLLAGWGWRRGTARAMEHRRGRLGRCRGRALHAGRLVLWDWAESSLHSPGHSPSWA